MRSRNFCAKDDAEPAGAGRLSKLTGHDKAVVDEMVRDIQQSHPQATREGILEDLEAWGFDPTYEQLEAEKPTREDILKAAKHDPILAGMVERGEMLSRSHWIMNAYSMRDMPNPWTPAHEQHVPRIFRRTNPEELCLQ
jgi:hypothetical protein